MKDLLSLRDLTTDEVAGLLDSADEFKAREAGSGCEPLLVDRPVGLAFGARGFRTRATFQLALRELGAIDIDLALNLDGNEPPADIAGYLEQWLHALVIRTPSHETLQVLAAASKFPVINAMTGEEHPCEVLADTQTIRERLGDLGAVKVVFVGGATNLCRSWFHMAARSALNLTQIAPEGYAIEPDTLALARNDGGGDVDVVHDLATAVQDADIIYTDGWPAPAPGQTPTDRDDAFRPFQVTAEVMRFAPPSCVVMPCPPATRGEEIAAEVLDSPWFIGYGAKVNLLHMHKAILVAALDEAASS